MDNEQTLYTAVTASLVVGFLAGSHFTVKIIKKNLKAKRSLLVNGIVSAVTRAREQDMTEEEFTAELLSELKFITIVLH